jgi:hypothetical protein
VSSILHIALGFYLGAAFITLLLVEGRPLNRLLSAALWFTFPLWPGRF